MEWRRLHSIYILYPLLTGTSHYPCSCALHVPAAETFHPVRFFHLLRPTFIHLSLHLHSVHSLLSATRRVRCECRSAVALLSHSHHSAPSPSVPMPCQYVFTLKRGISSSAAPCAFHLLTHSHHSASQHRELTPADDIAHGFVFAVIASLPPRLAVPHALGSRLCPLCSSSRSSLVALHCHSRIANYSLSSARTLTALAWVIAPSLSADAAWKRPTSHSAVRASRQVETWLFMNSWDVRGARATRYN